MCRHIAGVLCAGLAVAGLSIAAHADQVTYTFDKFRRLAPKDR
jgi:hypothetical protein